jgi:hypothetical protein
MQNTGAEPRRDIIARLVASKTSTQKHLKGARIFLVGNQGFRRPFSVGKLTVEKHHES